MKSPFSFIIAAIIVGILGGIAVGYWEARPWAASVGPTPTGRDAAKASSANSPDTTPGQPHVIVAEPTYNFGNMESGKTKRHDFLLKNEGDAPASIDYLTHTCKCTEVRLGGKKVDIGAGIVIPPHDEAKIMLEWAARVPAGPFRHGATFTTNDPKLERLELHVEGEIVASTSLEPVNLVFGSIHVGQPATAEMVVMSFLEPNIEILSHEVVGDQLKDRLTITTEPVDSGKLPNTQAKAGVRVIAHYDPQSTLGEFTGSVKLVTNLKDSDGNEQGFDVPVHGEVKGDVSIFLPRGPEANGLLRMKPIASAEGASETLTINIRGEHADEANLTVESVDPSQLKASVGEPKKMREGLIQLPLTVSIPAGTRPMVRAGEEQGGEGEIVLASKLPDAAQIRLRVLFTVLP